MSFKPTLPQARSLHAVSVHPAWPEVMKLFASELDVTLSMLADTHDDVALRQLQGRAKLLKEIQQLVGDLPAVLEKLERTKRAL